MSVNISNPAELQRLLDRTGLERARDGVGFVLKRGVGNAERGMILAGASEVSSHFLRSVEHADAKSEGHDLAPADTQRRAA